MALLYDDGRFNDNKSFKSTRLYKYIRSLFGIHPVFDGSFIPLECAGAIWEGKLDGSVDPNPMCKLCFTQLSFINKDTVVCETCHKNQTHVGEFHFSHNSHDISYDKAYEFAKAQWKSEIKEYIDDVM